jgi:hypothetical protein
MISRPSTEQILLDCCRELQEFVPAVDDDTVKVRIMMLEGVLRNTAVRSAHEIAWMREEIDDMQAYAHSVAESLDDRAGIDQALADLKEAQQQSLHLDDVVDTYRRGSEALSCALEAAVAAGDAALAERGTSLLQTRISRERVVMSGWSPVGR